MPFFQPFSEQSMHSLARFSCLDLLSSRRRFTHSPLRSSPLFSSAYLWSAAALLAPLVVGQSARQYPEAVLIVAINAVWISAVLHGLSAAPGARWYAARIAAKGACPEMVLVDVSENPIITRWCAIPPISWRQLGYVCRFQGRLVALPMRSFVRWPPKGCGRVPDFHHACNSRQR